MDAGDSTPTGSVSVNSSTRFLSSLMGRSCRLSCVFKTVQSCFLDAHALQPGAGKPAQAVENLDANIFRGWNIFAKYIDFFIQVLVVEGFDDFAFDKRVEVGQIRDHACGAVHRPGKGDFHDVVVPVPVRIAAFAIDAPVLLLSELRAV